MAATPSIKVIKQFNYRAGTRQWSNRYHFTGGTPSSGSLWTTLSDNIVTAEKGIYQDVANDPIVEVKIVGTIGYDAGSDVPVFSKTYATAATGNFANYGYCPGECAIIARYDTAARTSKNHPVYLFNYYHGCFSVGTGLPDDANVAQSAAILSYMNAWITGFSDGSTTYHRGGPNGAAATGSFVDPYIGHRDFPR